MPEHETYDLDAAFARLEHDIAGLSSPRGAAFAVTTARRRRRTTISAVVAATVLVVGAVAVGQGWSSRDQSVAPPTISPRRLLSTDRTCPRRPPAGHLAGLSGPPRLG